MIYEDLIKKLLHLFHAAAQSDDQVHLLEVSAILDIIQEKLPSIFPDMPEGYKNIISTRALVFYKGLHKKDISFEETYNQFLVFYEENKSEFTPELKAFCIDTTEQVLDSHAGINKAEQIFSERLKADIG